MCIQEHAISLAQQAGWIKRARARGFSLILSPPDPEASVPKGGVGLLAPTAFRATELPVLTESFGRARKLGRALRA
eukprot:216427-Lingulodinium_polyedra.AAC.1